MAVRTKPVSSKQAEKLVLPLYYRTRSYQDAAWEAFRQGKKRHVAVWHRRAGKDTTYLNITICAMLKRVGNYRHIFPTLKQGREILWDGISGHGVRYVDYFPEQLIYEKNESELSITLRHPDDWDKPGSQWQIVGTDRNLNALVGGNPIGLVLSEYALQHPQAWNLAQPILRENGGWAAFCYTPRGDNHGHDLYKMAMANPDEWYCSRLGIDHTRRDAEGEDGSPVILRSEVEADIRAGLIDEALAAQEYDCSFSAPQQGAYYAEQFKLAEQQGRIGPLTWRPDLPVYTAWDLGVNDSTAIWFIQPVGDRLHVIDYYEFWGQSLEHYVKVLKEKPYLYAGHYAPHDIEQREFAAHAVGTTAAKTRKEIASSLGLQFTTVGKWLIQEGIQAVRTMFPRFWFAITEAVNQGVKALRNYERLWDDKKKVFLNEPFHNWASHGADALRTFAVGFSTPQIGEGVIQFAGGTRFAWQSTAQNQRAVGTRPWSRR